MQNKLPQALCAHNKKPIGMPDIRVVTEVAGRICSLATEAGEAVEPDLTKAEASEKIDELQDKTGRGRG